MSTDPYPEVTVDESGIVPPQGGRGPEWPKKIRTLTASELDRLTIDGNGRFYWDGHLVNYEPPEPKEPVERTAESHDRSDMERIERDPYDLGEHKSPEPIEGADLAEPVESEMHVASREARQERDALDLDMTRPAPHHHDALAAEASVPMAVAHSIHTTERLRLKFSRWQSLGAVLVVLGVVVGASGMAAYGFVAAHDWGCRTGLIQTYCPAAMPGRPAARSDIPA